MEELLRLIAMQRGVKFPEHGMKEGDKVRMVNAAGHGFERTPEYFKNGETGTVVRTDLFLGMMPIFEVRPDSGATIVVDGQEVDVVPFGNERDFASVVKIEG